MLECDRIDVSEGIDVDKRNRSKKCILCHNWYFLDKNFTYGPYICDGCYNIMQKSIEIYIVHVKNCVYRIYFLCISKHEAKKLMINSNLIDKMGVL